VYPLFERCDAYKSDAPPFLCSHSLDMTRFVLLVLGLALTVSAQYGVPKPPQPGQPAAPAQAGAEQWLVIFQYFQNTVFKIYQSIFFCLKTFSRFKFISLFA
jgi:hypothetical protein